MKNLLFIAFIAFALVSCTEDEDPIVVVGPKIKTDSLTMDVRYANDIYYSLKDGVISTPSRTEWDIAFYTNPQTSTIITNDGNGVVLYVWPNGKKGDWAAADTTGLSTWSPLFNTYSDTTWENGAFDKNALGHPDYGWCVYNSTNHTLFGDSIHIVKFNDGSVKKLFIEKRDATNNTFYIQFSNLDGSDSTSAQIPCNSYLDKNLIHFSIINNQVVAHEPAKATWDLLFTKYADIGNNFGAVTGVLTNNKIQVAKMVDTDTASNDYSNATFSKALNTIGWDWKTLHMETSPIYYTINPKTLFFVKDLNNNYYKIVFTKFAGSSTGNIEYVKTTY
ncbi:MAG: hypothetical protein WCX31_17875 [Salinivirgaceae bacterium]|jgi:hypothetical protein